MNWKHRVKIKHLFTKNEDYDSIKSSMKSIYDVLVEDTHFDKFKYRSKFLNILEGKNSQYDVISSLDYANKLLDELYDYADDNKIWIE